MAGATVTIWNRLEPRVRTQSESIRRGLEARIRDPLWFLARQWQLQEFKGEDAATPMYIQLEATTAKLDSWLPPGNENDPVRLAGDLEYPQIPLETLINAESFGPDSSLQVELGQQLAAFLEASNLREDEKLAIAKGLAQTFPLGNNISIKLNQRLFEFSNNDFNPETPNQNFSTGVPIPDTLAVLFQDNGISLSGHTILRGKGTGTQWDHHWVIEDFFNTRCYALVFFQEFPTRWWVYRAEIIDHKTRRFLQICAARSIEGVAVYHELAAGNDLISQLPPEVSIIYQNQEVIFALGDLLADPQKSNVLTQLLDDYKNWVEQVFGPSISRDDSQNWLPERLEYHADFSAAMPNSDQEVKEIYKLSASPNRKGVYDWYTFDLMEKIREEEDVAIESFNRTVIPHPVKFRGIPNARFWQFENSRVNFAGIRPGKSDLAQLAVVDFMVVHSNDWYTIPFTQKIGTLCKVEKLIVNDLFGGKTEIERADKYQESETRRWTMYANSFDHNGNQFSDFFLLPPTISSAAKTSETLEEVRFIRDEMANLVWAIEHTTENGIGKPGLSHEKYIEGRPTVNKKNQPAGEVEALQYTIQTTVPDYWIPFVPVQIGDINNRHIILERAAMLDLVDRPYLDAQNIETINRLVLQPHTRLVKPSIEQNNYQIYEEEIPRSGIQVSRQAYLCRWIDGNTYLWLGRTKGSGRGEGSSGLQFDVAE